MTTRAEVPALTREREQVLVRALVVADPREPVVQDAAREKLLGHLAHDRAPLAISGREAIVVDGLQGGEVVLDQSEERRRLRAPRLVHAEGSSLGTAARRGTRIAVFATLGILALPTIGDGQPRPPTQATRARVIRPDSVSPARQVTPGQPGRGGTSDGPQVIPRVIGMTTKDAIDSLRWTKLRIVQLDSTTTSLAAGFVVNQRPRAGTPVYTARAETLFVTAAPHARPNRGRSWGDLLVPLLEAAVGAARPPRARPGDNAGGPAVVVPTDVPPTSGNDSVTVPGTRIQDRTRVPDLRENSSQMVTAALRKSRLNLGNVARDYSDDVPSGRVFRQEPPAGKEVVTFTDVAVWYSIGAHPLADTLSVPSVVGLTLAEAADSLKRTRLRAGHIDYLTRPGADGKVIHQSPHEGEVVHRNDAVDLTITTPPSQVTVPSVIKLTRQVARQKLEAAGLGVGRFTLVVLPGTDMGIVSQKPAPRTTVDSGTLVDLVENRAAEQRRVRVPDLSGKSIAAADSALKRDSLVLGDVLRPAVNAVDQVIDQRPQAGQTVFMHSTVTVALATGSPTQPAPTTRMPAVVNLTLDSARHILADSGFTHLSIGGGGDTLTSESIVESQIPAAGTFAAPGALVSLVARPPPPLPPVPNFVGLRREEARAAAEIDSLRIIVISAVRRLRLRDEVVSQTPIARSPRRLNNTVDVVVEIPIMPPVAVALLGFGVVAGAGGATVRRWRKRGRGDIPPSSVILKPVTGEPTPPVLHAEGRDTLISAAFTLRFGMDSGPWNLEAPADSIVKTEEAPDA